MARTFVAITGGGAGGAFVNDDPFGYKRVEKIRQALDLFAYGGVELDMGGDDNPMVIVTPATWRAVNRSKPRTVNFDNFGGLTKEFVFHYYSTDAGTSVQLRLRDTTNNLTMATSTLSAALTLTTQTVTLTNVPSSNAVIELQFDASNTSAGVVGYGYVRMRVVPV